MVTLRRDGRQGLRWWQVLLLLPMLVAVATGAVWEEGHRQPNRSMSWTVKDCRLCGARLTEPASVGNPAGFLRSAAATRTSTSDAYERLLGEPHRHDWTQAYREYIANGFCVMGVVYSDRDHPLHPEATHVAMAALETIADEPVELRRQVHRQIIDLTDRSELEAIEQRLNLQTVHMFGTEVESNGAETSVPPDADEWLHWLEHGRFQGAE